VKGIILCGGQGTRLGLLTKVINKHLLPIGNKPMVVHGVEMLVANHISEIAIVLGGNNVGEFVELLENGHDFGANITYIYQGKALGIAHAINCCKKFVGGDRFVVLLGDNIYGDMFSIFQFANSNLIVRNAILIYTKRKDPERFGVIKLVKDRIVDIVEKPKAFISDAVITGIYFFTWKYFEYFQNMKPSDRGEYEITDILREYNKNKSLVAIPYRGFWTDAGTPESYKLANNHFRKE